MPDALRMMVRAPTSEAARSAATIIRARNCATDGSISKPIVRWLEVDCGAIDDSYAFHRKQSLDAVCAQLVSVKKLYGAPLPGAPVPSKSADGVTVPNRGCSTRIVLPPPPLTPPGARVTT